jgi:hypothetical protein
MIFNGQPYIKEDFFLLPPQLYLVLDLSKSNFVKFNQIIKKL